MYLILIIMGVYMGTRIYIIRDIKHQEEEGVFSRVKHAEYLIDSSSEELNSISADWAPWDDTLEYMRKNNSEYIKSNINEYTFSTLKINTIIFLDKNNEIKYSAFFDLKNRSKEDLPKDLLYYIKDKGKLITNHKDVHSVISDKISVNGNPMIISSRPITDSWFSSPSEGTLIMGKYIDSSIINKIENVTESKIRINKINDSNGIISAGNKRIDFNKQDVYVEKVDRNKIVSYSIIKGTEGKPLFLLEMASKRTLYNNSIISVHFFILALIVCAISLFALAMILLKVLVIKPLETISNEVSKIDLTNSLISRVRAKGKDELGMLSFEINNMLEKIELNNKKLSESEKQLKLVLEGANAGFWDWNMEKDTLQFNERFLSITGYSKEEAPLSIRGWKELIHKDDYEYAQSFFKNSMWRTLGINIMELKILTKKGDYKWILNQCRVVEYTKDDKPKRMAGIITDIDDKKRYEQQLNYLTYYDKLTGIFNRGYYEFMIEKINSNGRLPLSIIMGDLNGLKITNDTFGHEEGDMLLKQSAEVLKEVCGSNAIVSRYGGDEFIIISENTNKMEAEAMCLKIKNECLKRKVGSIYINIALGHATKEKREQDIADIIKKAEEKMYRNKLLEDKSSRNSIISSLSKTLSEKSYETEEHAERIYNYCVKICELLNLSTSKADELYLLAKLHDIGKIAIDDKILNKKGKLTEEEWAVMKTHSEIGYRIASSNPDLRHIAYKILIHHERYDGTGYPKELKGDDIPLLSRIMTIVDAFDVMTHERPYKKAVSAEEAIKELRRCSGTQFDPNLVEICIKAFMEKESCENSEVI